MQSFQFWYRGGARLRVLQACFAVCILFVQPSSMQAQTRKKPTTVSPASISPSVSSSLTKKKLGDWPTRLQKAVGRLKQGRHSEAKKEFESLLAADKSNLIARMYLSEIHLAEGDWDAAKDILGRTRRSSRSARDPVPLVAWQLLGPFRHRGRSDSVRGSYEPEGKKFDAKASYRGDGRICRWRKAAGPRIDFRDVFGYEDDAVSFAYCEFSSKRSGWVQLGLGSSDGLKLWLNDDAIFQRTGDRDIQEDSDLVWAYVQRGTNRLLVKVESDDEAHRLYVQIHDDFTLPASEFLDAAVAGQKAIARGKFEDAERYLMKAEGLRSGHPEIAVGLAEAQLRTGNFVGARSWVTRALLDRPGMERALVIYAETMLGMEQPRKAFDALRAAYRVGDFKNEKVHATWLAAAKKHRSKLQEGIANIDRAIGLLKAKKKSEAAALIAQVKPRVEETFVGLAELSDYFSQARDRKQAGALGLRAIRLLTAEQVGIYCSTDWLVRVSKDLEASGDRRARDEILNFVQKADPGNEDYVKQLVSKLRRSKGSEAIATMDRIESILDKNPRASTYKAYAVYLGEKKLDSKLVTICREGLEAGIVSRSLLNWQGEALIRLKRLDEAEEVFLKLVDERDYASRAKAALEKIRKARGG